MKSVANSSTRVRAGMQQDRGIRAVEGFLQGVSAFAAMVRLFNDYFNSLEGSIIYIAIESQS